MKKTWVGHVHVRHEISSMGNIWENIRFEPLLPEALEPQYEQMYCTIWLPPHVDISNLNKASLQGTSLTLKAAQDGQTPVLGVKVGCYIKMPPSKVQALYLFLKCSYLLQLYPNIFPNLIS